MLIRKNPISSGFEFPTTEEDWNRLFVIKPILTVLAYSSEAMAYVLPGNKLHAKT